MIELSDSLGDWDPQAALEEVLAAAMEAGAVTDAVLAGSLAQAERIWALRHSISEANKAEGFTVSNDTSVPLSAIPDFLAQVDRALGQAFPQIEIGHCGHIGDGNVHVIGVFPHGTHDPERREDLAREVNRIVHEASLAFGGSIAAEHGIGRMHVARLAATKDPVALSVMKSLKAALDPEGLMNPGKIFARP